MAAESLILAPDPSGGYFVKCGDRWERGLTPDEALWVVAQHLNGRAPRYLQTDEQHGAEERRRHGPKPLPTVNCDGCAAEVDTSLGVGPAEPAAHRGWCDKANVTPTPVPAPAPDPAPLVVAAPCSECGFGDTLMCAAGCGVALCRNHELLHLTEKHPDWRPF